MRIEDVNVQDLFEIGKDMVQKMDGQLVFSYSHKWSLKAKTLASSKNVKVSAGRSIDPALLFQRFLVVSQTGDLQGQLQTVYSECPKFHPNPFTSGGVIAERVNVIQTHHKVFPILGEASASSLSNERLFKSILPTKAKSGSCGNQWL